MFVGGGREDELMDSPQNWHVVVLVVRETDAMSHPAWENETRPGRTRPTRPVLACKADYDRNFVWGECSARVGVFMGGCQQESQPKGLASQAQLREQNVRGVVVQGVSAGLQCLPVLHLPLRLMPC
jgi:hypothetical protein